MDRAGTFITSIVFAILVMGATCEARAQTAPAQLLQNNGQPGMWFPLESARRMLADLEELGSLRQQVTLLTQKLTLREETITLLTQNLDWTEQQAQHWRTALEAALRQQKQRPAFFDRPAVNFFLGFISAGAFSLGLLYGMDHVAGG